MRKMFALAFTLLFASAASAQQLYVPPVALSAITGDFTCTGAGACTLATVATPGTTGSSTAIPVVTINAKGLTTGIITTAAVVAPAGTLSGATLASGVTASSLTSFGASPTFTGTMTAATANFSGFITSTAAGVQGITAGASAGDAIAGIWKNPSVTAFSTVENDFYAANLLLGRVLFQRNNAGNGGILYIYTADSSAAQQIRMSISDTGAVTMPYLASTSSAQTGTLCWTTGTGNVTVDTTTTCLLSSARFKHDIQPLDNGKSLATVMALKPVSYVYNDPAIQGEQLGFVAEDVAQLDDRLVSREPDGSPRAVRYQQLTADLAGAIQAQQKQIEELRTRRWCVAGWCW